jgi:CHASE2 domain-containing sensor protein
MLAFDRLAGFAVGALATSSPTRKAPLDSAVFAALTAITIASACSSAGVTGWWP